MMAMYKTKPNFLKMKAIRIIFLIIIMMACTKENGDYKSVGTLTGIDGTMCGCCGGWIIFIEDVSYLIDSMPKESNIDLETETFPIKVKLDWQLVNNGCSVFNRITVQRIKKI
jgi:hypothetical protein